MENSAFQFTNPVLKEFEFIPNPGFDISRNKEVNMQNNISFQVTKMNDSNEAEVCLTVEIGEKSELIPFWIKASEFARFKWEDGIDSRIVDSLLNENAPALLLSFLRPIISQITAFSPFGIYNIPFINFTKSE